MAGTEFCASGTSTYTTMDLDGDAHVDLVFTKNCADGNNYVTGKTKWLLFRGQCM